MKTLIGAKTDASRGDPASLEELADEFQQHWLEVTRHLLNRRVRSSLTNAPVADLSPVELGALAALEGRDLRMSHLAATLGLSESAATRLVDRLEDAGLAERRPGKLDDRRCVFAGLTPVGRKAQRRIQAQRRRVLKDILESLSPGERSKLVELFGKVAAALATDEGPVVRP
jgi:DNA-binding MarR family transcriptional regulator